VDLISLIHLKCFISNLKVFGLYFLLFVFFSPYNGGFNSTHTLILLLLKPQGI
jgi:hypothetical protein